MLNRPEKIEWKIENYSEEDFRITPPEYLKWLSTPVKQYNLPGIINLPQRIPPEYPIKKYFSNSIMFMLNTIEITHASSSVPGEMRIIS